MSSAASSSSPDPLSADPVSPDPLSPDPLTPGPEVVRTLLDQAEFGLLLLDRSGCCRFANRTASRLLGFAESEILGQTLQADPRGILEPEALAADRAAPASPWYQGRLRRKDGEPLELELITRQLPPAWGDVRCVTFRDLTERKRFERVARAHTAALVNTLRGLTRRASMDTYLGEVLKALAEQLGERSAALWVYDEEAGILRLYLDYYNGQLKSGSETEHPGAWPVPPGVREQPGWMSFPTVFDVESSPGLDGYREFHRSRGVKGILVVPMFFSDRVVGTFSIRSTRRSTFAPEEIELAQSLAHQATLALQLTRLAEESSRTAVAEERERAAQERAASLAVANRALEAEVQERRRAEEALRRSEESLRRTLGILASDPPLDTFLGHVLGTVAQQLSAPACTLWFYVPEEQVFRIHMSYGDGRAQRGQLEGRGVHGPVELDERRPELQQALLTCRPVLLNDVSTNPHVEQHRAWLQSRGVKAVLLVPLVIGENVFGVIGVHNTERERWSEEETELARALAGHASLAIQLTRLAEQARRAAVVEERNRMAREIHDTLAQGFTGVVVQLEAAEDSLDLSPDEVHRHLEAAKELARESLMEARRSVRALRPLALETAELEDALRRMVDRLAGLSTVTVSFALEGDPRPLRTDVSSNLLRAAQEALANAFRHAEASEIEVILEFTADRVCLRVRDNGRGFDPVATGDGKGLGLLGLSERAERIGGSLVIRSHPGTGTEIALSAPLD